MNRMKKATLLLFPFGFLVLLVEDLMTTVKNGTSTLDIQLHDTFFVIANVHVKLFFAMLFLALSAVYSVFPKITSRTINAAMGYIHFAITLIGAYFLCLPYHYTGLTGMLRGYMDYSNWVSLDGFSGGNHFILQAMILMACGQVVFVANLVWSLVKGRKRRPT
jgi:cytochrome c oxidase subunit 1